MNDDTIPDRYFSVPDLIARWPLGRTKVYEIIKDPGFPEALVLFRDRQGRPRSMGFLLGEIVAYEARHRAPVGELACYLDSEDSRDSEDTEDPRHPVTASGPAALPAAKKAMPRRRFA
jgi:predicted DNA-binding transcriptional regulator AlpA